MQMGIMVTYVSCGASTSCPPTAQGTDERQWEARLRGTGDAIVPAEPELMRNSRSDYPTLSPGGLNQPSLRNRSPQRDSA